MHIYAFFVQLREVVRMQDSSSLPAAQILFAAFTTFSWTVYGASIGMGQNLYACVALLPGG